MRGDQATLFSFAIRYAERPLCHRGYWIYLADVGYKKGGDFYPALSFWRWRESNSMTFFKLD